MRSSRLPRLPVYRVIFRVAADVPRIAYSHLNSLRDVMARGSSARRLGRHMLTLVRSPLTEVPQCRPVNERTRLTNSHSFIKLNSAQITQN